jgi:hypothetical protein
MKPLAEWTEQELLDYGRDGIMPGHLRALEEQAIQWLPEPPFRIEEIDLLGLTPDEIVRVAFLMQTVLRDARQLIHVVVEQLARITRERDSARRQLAQTRRR